VELKYLLDTNTVLYYLTGKLDEALPDGDLYVSAITEVELLSYPDLTEKESDDIERFLSRLELAELSPAVVRLAAQLRRQKRMKLPDAIIAASAIHLGAELLTNDLRLMNVPGLKCRSLRLK
jgi:predicted nucleic acid-binding protein